MTTEAGNVGSTPPLGTRLGRDPSSEQIADTVGAIWLEIDQALNPIIGRRGVAALYNRSLKLASVAYPWLASGFQSNASAVEPAALRAALAKQPAAQAAAAGTALFNSFHELLASLVGVSLTDRLLRSVWDHPSGAASAQDDNP